MNLSEYFDYFFKMAENHKLIGHTNQEKHAFLVELFSLEESLRSAVHWPLVAVETPMKESQNSTFANLRWSWHGAILILDKWSDQGDTTKGEEVDNRCLQIAEDFVAKMVKDRRDYSVANKAFVLEGLDAASLSIEVVPRGWGDFKGCRLSFDFGEPMARFDASKWNNESIHTP